MQKRAIISVFIFLTACSRFVPIYNYENTHILDYALQKDDVCIVIDNHKTSYAKGVQRLYTDPFLGNETYNPNYVNKYRRNYNHNYENKSCKNPIRISRNIKVSSIVYPGICTELLYAGSIYTGSSTYSSGFGSATALGNSIYGSYSGTSNTYTHSIPMFNTHRYSCIKEKYLTEIEFFINSRYLGKIENEEWNEYNTDYTIEVYTEEFIKILNRSQ